MDNAESQRINLSLRKPVYDALSKEAAKTGRRVGTYCNYILTQKAEEIIEEAEKKEGK